MANEQKKTRRFNLFDAIVIGLILLLAIGVYAVIHARGGQETTTTVTYIVELVNLPEGSESLVTVGEHFKENTKNYDAGVVTEVEVVPYTVDVTNEETGNTCMAEVPDRETLLITLEVDATETEIELTSADGMTLRVGQSIYVSNNQLTGSGYIVHIER